VLRDGDVKEVNIYNLLVGDVVEIKTGEKLPVDGILINASSMLSDESAMTGEPDSVKKTVHSEDGGHPYLLSGAKITEGRGRMLVLAVGPESF
jgi:P-type E1-E2 ATPase